MGQLRAFIAGRRLDPARLSLVAVLAVVAFGVGPQSAGATSFNAVWSQACPSSACTTSPGPRNGAAMTYDAATGKVVLFGGDYFGSLSDTWTWDGTKWTKVCPSASCTTSPPGRSEATMAYDAATGQVVLVDGRTSSSVLFDTWVWDGTTWHQVCPSAACTNFPDVGGAAMAYDAASGQLVLFGGYTSSYTDQFTNATWTWDGTAWHQVCPSTTCTVSPAARAWGNMTYDPSLGGAVLAAGFNNSVYNSDAWLWNGTGWRQVCPSSSCSSGPSGEGAGMAFDDVVNDIIFWAFAGFGTPATLAWDGQTNWTQICPGASCPTMPPGRRFASMAFDAAAGEIVLFGGNDANGTALSDTWTLQTQIPDSTPPTTTDDAPSGWSNAAVTVHLTATDSGSGVAATYYSVDGGPFIQGTQVVVPAPADGANDGLHTIQFYSVDHAGNQEAIEYASVGIDTTPPSISATQSPAPNSAGWNNTPVTVSFTCSDPVSGIASCPAPMIVGEGAAQTVTATAVDNAGNHTSVSAGPINVDLTAPTLVGVPTSSPTGGWYRGDVSIHWTCSDSLSGIAGACPSNSLLTGEGTAVTDTESVTDVAGNTTVATSDPVRIDRTAPVTTAAAPSGWLNGQVTVQLSAFDSLSGVDQTFYRLDGATTQTGTTIGVSGDGVHTLTFWSSDLAGNTEQEHSITIRIDSTAPTITHTLDPAPNGNGWNNRSVVVSFTCSDDLSGILFCTPSQTVASEGANQVVTGQATDNAGNTASDSASVSLDLTPPSIEASADRMPNQAGWFNSDVSVAFTCSDGLSGVASCPSPVTLHEGANQSATGTATDAAGNQATTTLSGFNIDETPPSIAFAGNSGTYSLDEQVSITCTSADALSGVASSSCAQISGPAYTFGLGTTVSTASATDLAGNTSTAATSFTVVVTAQGIEALIRQLVTGSDAQNQLITQIENITTAPDAQSKNGRLGAFNHQVDRLTPGGISPANAALLKQFASAL